MTDLRFADHAARLAEFIQDSAPPSPALGEPSAAEADRSFNQLALELFALQYQANPAYGRFCANRGLDAATVRHWREIPAIPAAAFKELELTSLPTAERTAVFCSSGTTDFKPSRHYHNRDSLNLYEASLLPWFKIHWRGDSGSSEANPGPLLIFLSPPPGSAPRSSLVHMFETIRRASAQVEAAFLGITAPDGSRIWPRRVPLFVCAKTAGTAARHTTSVRMNVMISSLLFRAAIAVRRRSNSSFQGPSPGCPWAPIAAAAPRLRVL